jgi:GWxTD domain-containing protein
MKNFLTALILTGLTAVTTNSLSQQALFSYKTFWSPDQGPYVETYLSVNASTVKYSKTSSGKFQGSIQIQSVFTDNSGQVRHQDRYNLLSPEFDDANNVQYYFLDQQRVQLPNGSYKLELSITDNNNPDAKTHKLSEVIKIEYYHNIAKVSDIQLVESYSKSTSAGVLTKSGIDLVPYVDNFYPNHINRLKFYSEIYNTDQILGNTPFLVSYFIESAESKQPLENLKGFSRENSSKVVVLLREIPLEDLPSGNYNLVIEARNQQNEIIAYNSVFFQRSNRAMVPVAGSDMSQVDVSNTFASFITNPDSLAEYINSLYPIASPIEVTFITNQLKLADLKIMQQFFYEFWARRSPLNPEKAWMDYYVEVLKVNNEFGTRIRRGHATERGRVYLKYGPPNTISKSYTEPSAYPYEIWHYYRLGSQTNRKFVFYNPDLVTNDFTLLHSDAQGEPFNNQWQLIIHKRDTQSLNYDKEDKGDNYFGNKAKENFENPR